MANQSIIAIPPNIGQDDAVILKRFLLKLVEELDIVIGFRGDSSSSIINLDKRITALEEASNG